MNTADLSLVELQKATLDDPDNLELKEALHQMVADWCHLEDCWMETPD